MSVCYISDPPGEKSKADYISEELHTLRRERNIAERKLGAVLRYCEAHMGHAPATDHLLREISWTVLKG